MEEERWNALLFLGLLLIEENFAAGAQMLVQTWAQRPIRAEPLRALAAFADQVADGLAFPEDEVMPIRREFYGPQK